MLLLPEDQVIDDLYDLIGGRQTVWAAAEPFVEEYSRMTHSVNFVKEY